jgi:hypothetical protein
MMTRDHIDKQLLYGTKGALFQALDVPPVRSRQSQFVFIHYSIQSQSGDQSLLKVFQDTCCSSTAMRDEVAGRDIMGSNAGNVILEVTGSQQTQEPTLDFLLNQQDGYMNSLRMHNAIIVDKIIQNIPMRDTSHQVERLLKEMKEVCRVHEMEYDVDEENIPRRYGGQLDLLIGNSVFELKTLFSSSFGLSLYQVPLLINGKRSYAIGGYLESEAGFEKEPELFIRKTGKTINDKKQPLTLWNQDPKRHTLGIPERQTPARLNPDPLTSTGILRADLHTQGTLQLCACMNHSKPSGKWKNLTKISEEDKIIVSHKEQGTK